MGSSDVRRRYSPSELTEFEAHWRSTLPATYRTYLTMVGGGLGLRVDLLENWCEPYSVEDLSPEYLREPFPHRQAWNDTSLIKHALGFRSPYFDPKLTQGSMRITNMGCECYRLLVITGPERGSVWVDDRADYGGIRPLFDRRGKRVTIDAYLRSRLPLWVLRLRPLRR